MPTEQTPTVYRDALMKICEIHELSTHYSCDQLLIVQIAREALAADARPPKMDYPTHNLAKAILEAAEAQRTIFLQKKKKLNRRGNIGNSSR